MISKQEFVSIMDYFQEQNDMEEDLTGLFRQYKYEDFRDGSMFVDLKAQDIIINLLTNMFNDKYSWIEWWVLETLCGNNNPVYYDKYGHVKYLHNAEDLYNLLTEN